ncbi:cytochrome c biogenesis protein CcdA [Paroceanicella profunda]|uniref:Cytochrome c biogenesis protein CcdA n=1 Tax=Paroceanicella profunda TaxID=2579971 RepID=A0A5B8FYU1_9RHOB|nr:cytochrome c biogenesis protein CcdA [Paroceanicella profunda]QDL91363.1 cytochrome c biogenesis protein CcdA [Paroceanicella profunda]
MFGIDFIEASAGIKLAIALVAGIVSFLTPCVLPIVPPYLAFMAGTSLDRMTEDGAPDRRRVVTAALFFVLGLSTVFVLLGAVASSLGQAFLQNQLWFSRIAGVVVIVFGLHFLGVFRIGLLYREARFDAGRAAGGPLGAFVLGLAFAFGWTPCIGPILGTILSLAAQGASDQAIFLLGTYAIGLGVPFILAALFIGPFTRFMRRFRSHMGTVERVMGGMLVLVGIMMVTDSFSRFSYWLLETFPALGMIG